METQVGPDRRPCFRSSVLRLFRQQRSASTRPPVGFSGKSPRRAGVDHFGYGGGGYSVAACGQLDSRVKISPGHEACAWMIWRPLAFEIPLRLIETLPNVKLKLVVPRGS